MDRKLSKRYQELFDGLKDLFKELATLQAENERLTQENVSLREEVSMLRLYMDTYLQEGESPADLQELDLTPAMVSSPTTTSESNAPSISDDALAFYNSLPQSFNFSELFELADLLGVEKHKMKGYMTTYLRENLMQQHGTRVEKITDPGRRWDRSVEDEDD